MATDAAQRQRLCRARKRAHLTRYVVWAREDWLGDVLKAAQLLPAELADDHTEIQRVLQHAIDLWIEPVTGDSADF
jgi:hypothetical protein